MSNSETSANYEVIIDTNVTGDDTRKLLEVHNYFDRLIDDIKARIDSVSRSVFDFVDMAVVIGALSNMTNDKKGGETKRYIKFVREEFLPTTEREKKMIATAFYCLMRCGLVHELSLGGHGILPTRKTALKGFSVAVTHDASPIGGWYSIDQTSKEVVFYAHELLVEMKGVVAKCFVPNSSFEAIIKSNLTSGKIGIVKIKP